MYKKYLINYSDVYFEQSQKSNSESGISIGGFDEVIEYQKKDIDINFSNKNHHILSQSRGAGYWLWKPYFIYKTLLNLEYNDILFYCDSGSNFINNISSLIPVMDRNNKNILVFELDGHKNITWIKRDCLILTNSDQQSLLDQNMILAGYIMLRKTEFTVNFIKSWLDFCEDHRIITDANNELGVPNYPEFIDHRHDQSVLSLLSRKYDLNILPDISQFGANMKGHNQYIFLHRNKN